MEPGFGDVALISTLIVIALVAIFRALHQRSKRTGNEWPVVAFMLMALFSNLVAMTISAEGGYIHAISQSLTGVMLGFSVVYFATAAASSLWAGWQRR